MTDNTINALPEIFKNNICTLKRASLDDTNRQYMCDSCLKVIHFDKLPKEYARGLIQSVPFYVSDVHRTTLHPIYTGMLPQNRRHIRPDLHILLTLVLSPL